MDRTYRFRISLVIVILALVAGVYAIRLFGLQLTEDEDAAYNPSSTTTYTQTVSAARGEILDRHGTVLVRNRATYNVIINSFVLYNSGKTNDYLLALGETCIKNGIEYRDTLPVSQKAPYTYITDELDSNASYNYQQFILRRGWDSDMSAGNLIKKLSSAYNIPEEYTEEQARMVIGLRYELDLPVRVYTPAYTLSEDVSAEELAIIKELAVPGLEVTTTTVRECNTTYAAQLLGHVRAMDPEQYENIYKDMGYAMDAKVGQEGLELAFEEYLHGTDGQKVVTVASDGTVLDEYWEVEPQSGSNVVTTIDIGLQAEAERLLAERIQEVAEAGKEKVEKGKKEQGEDACAGSVVVMDVNNFEVLAAANYPTYDPHDYFKKYAEYSKLEVSPLRNRALDNAYPPGSTFKPITAIAALRYGYNAGMTVDDTGRYMKYEDINFTPGCWIFKASDYTYAHGTLDMRGAIAQSCNMYFYTVGDEMGVKNIIPTAESFGVGKDPGSEVPCEWGQMASPETKAKEYANSIYKEERGWYSADNVVAAIGQSVTKMTPLQMCRYTCALANRGTLYKATFLRRTVSSDFQTLVKANDYQPEATGLLSDTEYQVIYDGMRQCVMEGTGEKLKDYDVAVCAKTGTAEHGSGGSDHGAFICWAPADNPRIAIAIYVEHGASGSNFTEVAQGIMDYYFNWQNQSQEIEIENRMTED